MKKKRKAKRIGELLKEKQDKKKALARARRKDNMVKWIFRDQIRTCKKKEEQTPAYDIDEFIEWFWEQPQSNYLFRRWVNSKYDKYNKPCVIKISIRAPYSFDNIRVTDQRDARITNLERMTLARRLVKKRRAKEI